ncbi:MAG: hypothetical protein WEE03_12110 [Chloroflexota bacterium]
MIADRIADEERARAQLDRFAGRLFDAAEALARQLKSDGVEMASHRGRGEASSRLELRVAGLPERIVLLAQRAVACVPDHPVPHGALYVFVVTETAGVLAERFLVSAEDDVHCDGVCAPAERNEPIATVRRLVEAIWAEGRQFWTPFTAVGPVLSTELEAPHLHGQIGFRPRAVPRTD